MRPLQLASIGLALAVLPGCVPKLNIARPQMYVPPVPTSNYIWTNGPYRFDLIIDAAPRLLDLQNVTFFVSDSAGRGIPGCHTTADLSMPSMTMPEDTVEFRSFPSSPGSFQGDGRFTMSGQWVMTVNVTRNGKSITSHTIPVTVR